MAGWLSVWQTLKDIGTHRDKQLEFLGIMARLLGDRVVWDQSNTKTAFYHQFTSVKCSESVSVDCTFNSETWFMVSLTPWLDHCT